MEEEIKKLKERIEELEKRPNIVPVYPPIQYIPYPSYPGLPVPMNPNLHYHNGSPCYNNPCVWCMVIIIN